MIKRNTDKVAEKLILKLGPLIGEPVLTIEEVEKEQPSELAQWKAMVFEAINEIEGKSLTRRAI